MCVRANKFDIEYHLHSQERRPNWNAYSIYIYMWCVVDVYSTTYSFNTAVIIPFVGHQRTTLHFYFYLWIAAAAVCCYCFVRAGLNAAAHQNLSNACLCMSTVVSVKEEQQQHWNGSVVKTAKMYRKNENLVVAVERHQCVMFTFGWCEWGSFVHSARARPTDASGICAAENYVLHRCALNSRIIELFMNFLWFMRACDESSIDERRSAWLTGQRLGSVQTHVLHTKRIGRTRRSGEEQQQQRNPWVHKLWLIDEINPTSKRCDKFSQI